MYRLKYLNIDREYKQYHDYVFKKITQKYTEGALKLMGIPFKIKRLIVSEIASDGPKIQRLDFACEVEKDGETICLILECQSRIPTEEDIKRFFQYVTSLINLKGKKVELYILTLQKPLKDKYEFVLNDETKYIMHVISLKYIKANDILKRIEDKIRNNEEFEQEDIAALQLIVYTYYDETPLDILKKATKLIEKMDINVNEKEAMFYVLDVISTNMLNKKDRDELMEDSKMLNPRYEYQRNEGKLEGKLEVARELLEIFPVDRVAEITKLPVSDIMDLL